jgi:hypothetical protein
MINQNSGTSGFKAGIEIGPDGKSTGNIVCYPSDAPNCIVVRTPEPGLMDTTGFVSLSSAKPFHDDELISASAEVNKVLSKVMTKQNSRMLHVTLTSDGPMFVWAHGMTMEADDIRKSGGMAN